MKTRGYCGVWDSDSGVSVDLGLPGCRRSVQSRRPTVFEYLCKGAV